MDFSSSISNKNDFYFHPDCNAKSRSLWNFTKDNNNYQLNRSAVTDQYAYANAGQ